MPSAYVTGGASGIGRAVAQMLVKHNIKVFIADRDIAGAETVVKELNTSAKVASCAQVDVADWDSQAKAFGQAVAELGRVDYVYPIAGIGERRWLPADAGGSGFQKPDLTAIDVDLTGVLYTVALAVQQFRRQGPGENGFRGKIGCVSSICGIYAIPTVPVYTAAKHGVTGFVRSYGKYLVEEKITMNAANPNVVETHISTGEFYEKVKQANLLTPIEGVVSVFENLLGTNDTSGECFEVGPTFNKKGAVRRAPPEILDPETQRLNDMIEKRSRVIQVPL